MVYIACFIASVFFAWLAKRAGNKTAFILCSAFSLIIPIMLAALRDYSVGVDTINYLEMDLYWHGASGGSLTGYLKYYFQNGGREPIFALFMGIIARVTGEYRVFLFLAQTVIMVGVYVGAYRMKDHSDPVLTLLLFYLLYYNYTMNAIRQYMSLAILFAAIHDIEERKIRRYIVFVVIASLIHNVAVLGIPLLILYYLIYGRSKARGEDAVFQQERVSLVKRVVIGGLLIGVFLCFSEIAQALIKIGLLNSKYLKYLNSKSNASFLASRMFLLVEIAGLLLIIRQFRSNNIHPDFYIFCTIAFLLLFQLSTVMRTGARIARFFSLINISTIGMMVRGQRGEKKILVGFAVIAVALLYWIYTYGYTNYSHTMPYALGL